jgi:hypothetical protein
MYEVETQGVQFTNILGGGVLIKRLGKSITLLPNKSVNMSDLKSRKLMDNDIITLSAKTFATLADSTNYPDPYTMMTILPNSEFKIRIKPWEVINKEKDERTSGFKITEIELIKGIFKINTGSIVKAKNASFSFPKKKGTIKIEITNNAMYIGGNEANISGPFTIKPLNITQFSEYIIVGSKFYKKSLLAMNEENRMDERFMALDPILLKILGTGMGNYKDSDKMHEQMNKNAQSFSPENILKGFENAMNMTPEMLKGSGLSDEQIKQMTQGIAKMKKELTPDKMAEIKGAFGR